MTSTWVFAHLFALGHGLAAAVGSIAFFFVGGLLLLPRRWQGGLRWPDRVVLGLTVYVLLCWVATSSRHIPIGYVILAFVAVLWGLASLRFRWLQAMLGAPRENVEVRRWLVDFSILYVFSYVLVRPPAGAALLPLPPGGSLDLVTYARYAKHVLTLGTANVDLATFEYLHSPASAYLLAWHSLLFIGDPLDAAMPLLFMLAALFGMVGAELARSVFGLSRRSAMAIAAIALCAPMFRWTLASYSLGELLSATCVLYLAGVIGRAGVARSIAGPLFPGIAAGGTLLFLAGWATLGSPGSIAVGVVEAARHFSAVALLGLPGGMSQAAATPDVLRSAALVVLPIVPLLWAAEAHILRRLFALDRVKMLTVDRQLAKALVLYVGVAVILGNVAVQAVSSPEPVYRPGGWRQLGQIGRMPFKSFTIKVADQPDGLSTMLAMYYMPGRKAHVIGRGVSVNQLPFETVSRQQPMLIQNFGCQGVGHDDTVSVSRVGCFLMAPPGMTVGTSYPFSQTFLFLNFDRMTAREPGGRWNTHPALNLRLTADPERARLDREMYINFLVNPFLPAGVEPQRLVLKWGKDRRGEIQVGQKQWFSLAVTSGDWNGNRLWTMPVAIDFPKGRTLLFQEVALTESPRGDSALR